MATSSDKEKAVSKALRKLTKVMHQKMNGFDVNVGLYGCGQVTYSEYERIRASKSVPEANDEVFSVLQRRGPDILDALLEVLKEEEDANKHLIDKINEGIKLIRILIENIVSIMHSFSLDVSYLCWCCAYEHVIHVYTLGFLKIE